MGNPAVDEIQKENAAWDAMMKKITLADPIIAALKAEHKGQNWDGVKECPVCGGSLLLAMFAENGHVNGRCNTPGCLQWME